jgi:fatty acid desaturase
MFVPTINLLTHTSMKKNMGSADRIIRLAIAAVLAFLYFNGTLTGTFGIVALVVAAIFTLTSVVSSCPIYSLLGMSTCPVEKRGV